MMLIFARFLFLFFLLPVAANSAKTPIKYSLGENYISDEWKLHLKNINLSRSREVNGLKLFIKPMTIEAEKTVKMKDVPNKIKDNIENQVIIMIGIINISNKPILVCDCGFLSRNSSMSIWGGERGGERGGEIQTLMSVMIHHIHSQTSESVVMLQPGQILSTTRNLRDYDLFEKGHNYNIFMKYGFSSKRSSPAKFFPSIDGNVDYTQTISLPVWEGELQSNALTVIVR